MAGVGVGQKTENLLANPTGQIAQAGYHRRLKILCPTHPWLKV
jgi:hypothetical protein